VSSNSSRVADAYALLAKSEKREEGDGVPFYSISDSYLAFLKVHAKPKSILGATSCAGRLLEHFGNQDARSLRAVDLDRFILARQGQRVKPKTINGDLITLRSILNHAVRTGLLESLPVRVRLLKCARKRVLPLLESQDIRSLLEHARDPYLGILLVSAHTGFRLNEILHLTWSDVLWNEGKLAVTAKDGWQSKSYEERAVYVLEEVLKHLKRVRMASRFKDARDYVFAGRNGKPRSTWSACSQVRRVFKRAGLYQKGIPLTHWIRHSVASRLLGEGVDVETVRRVLGHADVSTTLLYAHTSDQRMRAASQKLRWA
jgi:site-specific recombinase XerD